MTFPAADPSRRMCKRVTVILCALGHLVVTLCVLHIMLRSSGTFYLLNCFRDSNPYRSQRGDLTALQQANRKAAIEFRRQRAPLLLMLRVKDIEAEVAMGIQGKAAENSNDKTEEEEMQELTKVETSQQGVPAVTDNAIGAIQRHLLPPEKCQAEPNTDFSGTLIRWGLTYHVSNAAECCKACSKQASYARGKQPKCNVWVFCPRKSGCPSPDGYEHKFGECWLKQADKPHPIADNYPSVMLDKSVPPISVLWISGVVQVDE